ncbi:MAG: hypothetical protein MUF05_07250 [Candidatus Omnitrophica bacterium]|nr:hypothetical protein [Candidatus Omnitrophota bacterium]
MFCFIRVLVLLFFASQSAFAAAAIPQKRKVVIQEEIQVQGQPSEVSRSVPGVPAGGTVIQPTPNINQNPPGASQAPAASSVGISQFPADAQSSQVIVPQEQKPSEDFYLLVNSMRSSSQKWAKILDQKVKELLVYYFITEYSEKNVKIKNAPAMYVNFIDDMSIQSPQMLEQPLPLIIQIAAVIEYDFDNGQDKDLMAKSILGEEGYLNNKKRLGLK